MTVFVDTARYHTVRDGSDYWFCASACLHAFETNPEAYAKQG
jgi:YHS domain-containing protein